MKCIFSAVFACVTLCAHAQSPVSKPVYQSFFAEVGGPGVLFSANFDTRFKKTPLGIGARLGLGFVSGYYPTQIDSFGYAYGYGNARSIVTVPFQINYLFGKPNSVSALEIGAGATYIGRKIDVFHNDYFGQKRTQIVGTASFMYRRMPKQGDFSWRAGFTPVIQNGYIQPSAAASIGYNF